MHLEAVPATERLGRDSGLFVPHARRVSAIRNGTKESNVYKEFLRVGLLTLPISSPRWLRLPTVKLHAYRRLAVVLLLGGVIGSGCVSQKSASNDAAGASAKANASAAKEGMTWISDPKVGLYVKVPSAWKRFKVDPYKVDTDRIDPPKRRFGWGYVADAAKKPSVRHSEAPAPAAPVVQVFYRDLPTNWKVEDTRGRDSVSLSTLRGLAASDTFRNNFGDGDAIGLWFDGEPGVEVLSYSDIFLANGDWGNRIRFNYTVTRDPEDEAKDVWATVDQYAFVDRAQSRLFVVRTKCEAKCFRKNKGQLDRIMDSVRLKTFDVAKQPKTNEVKESDPRPTASASADALDTTPPDDAAVADTLAADSVPADTDPGAADTIAAEDAAAVDDTAVDDSAADAGAPTGATLPEPVGDGGSAGDPAGVDGLTFDAAEDPATATKDTTSAAAAGASGEKGNS